MKSYTPEILYLLIAIVVGVHSHANLIYPRPRSSEYDICGGYTGKSCGLCGTLNNNPGPITQKFRTGQIITARVRISTGHKGSMAFTLCSQGPRARRGCFAPLQVVGTTRFKRSKTVPIYEMGEKIVYIDTRLQLPKGTKCHNCILRWYYFGKVTKEHYYACSDISIGNYVQPTDPPKQMKVTCKGRSSRNRGMDQWCRTRCGPYGSFCTNFTPCVCTPP